VTVPALQPFLGAPAALHSCKPKRAPQQANRQQQSRTLDVPQPQQQPQQQQPRPRKGVFRRLKLLCASTVRALPAAGIKAAVLGGVEQLSSVTLFAGLSGAVVAGLALGVAGKGVRRWHAGRRAAKRAMVTAREGAATDVSILSFNIRGIMDRWPERAPVLRQVLKQADADVVCFQEVLTGVCVGCVGVLGGQGAMCCRASKQRLHDAAASGPLPHYGRAMQGHDCAVALTAMHSSRAA
jgi:hypothetical protein